jgi:hypothetical protein
MQRRRDRRGDEVEEAKRSRGKFYAEAKRLREDEVEEAKRKF